MNVKTVLLMAAAVASLSACGGGDGTPADPNAQALTPGTYKLAFSAISTARLAAPISGIDVAVKLPTGIAVSTVTGGSGQISPASITPGSAIQATALAFGNYSASTRTAYLTMATTSESFRKGHFLSLLFTVAPGSSVTPKDIFTLNATYLHYKVVGVDTVTHGSVNMSGNVTTTLGVER